MLLADLPLPIVADIAQYVSLLECRKLVMTCQAFWMGRECIEGARHIHMVITTRPERLFFQQLRPAKLETLDLGDTATDAYLIAFKWSEEFPLLREISMEGSAKVRGLYVLASFADHPSVRYVNVVFCPLVEYFDALRLKVALKQPDAIIQRMPSELIGRVQTTVQDEGVHRYWPDGTFQYDRSQQAVGFVKKLVRRSPEGIITLVQQFCDLDRGLTPLERSLLTPSVNVILLGSKNKHKSRDILVAHGWEKLQPLEDLPTMEHAALALGDSIFFDANGVQQEAQNDESDSLVTKIKVWELDIPTPPDKTLAMIARELSVIMAC